MEQSGMAAADYQADARKDVAAGGETAGVNVAVDVIDAISGTSRATASILAALTPTSSAPTNPGV